MVRMRIRLVIALVLGLAGLPVLAAQPAQASAGSWVTSGAVTLVTSTETAVLTSGSVTIGEGGNGQGVLVGGVANLVPGTTTTAIVLSVRAGRGTGGALIGAQVSQTVTAGNNYQIPYAAIDPTLNGSVSYTLTITQTGGSANGTVNQANITLATISNP